MPLQYRETYVNETRGHSFGQSPWLDYNGTKGDLFRSCRSEYGRATSMYADLKDGRTIKTGWVFSKRMEYEDAHRISDRSERTYIREVWVEVREEAEDEGR